MRLIASLAVATSLVITSLSGIVTAADEKAKAAPLSSLVLSEPPVSVNGPFPAKLRGAKVGDLVQVQITYPIVPPFPESAKLILKSRAFSEVGVFRTDGQVAILTPKPQQGAIGVGYISAFVKAVTPAKSAGFEVEVRDSAGKVKIVPFMFSIAEQGAND